MSVKNILFRVKNKVLLKYEASPYFSQDDQDNYIYEEFFGDIGANDGIILSDTFFLKNSLGWNGVFVQPNSDTFKALQKIRKNLAKAK